MLLRQCVGLHNSNNDDQQGNISNCNVYHLIRRLGIKKSNISKFELLPNELLFIIFQYLYCDDIIYAFNNLNYRLQLLLYSYEYYHLNFDQIIMKSKYNLIQNLPLNIQHVRSLTLSNNVNSCINIEECLLKYPIELFYTRLQSLSIFPKDADQLLSLTLLLPNFQQLKYLLISKKTDMSRDDTIEQIRNIILFEIKTLKYFTWNCPTLFFLTGKYKTLPIQKSTIEHYEIETLFTDDLDWLNLHTINMKSIHIYMILFSEFSPEQQQQKQTFQTLSSLKIHSLSADKSQNLLKDLSLLTQLKQLELRCDHDLICDQSYYIDGYKWENFIRKYIPQLEIFKFFFASEHSIEMIININELIKSFMTDFWLIEKKWFITCDYYKNLTRLKVYTVPYMGKEYTDDIFLKSSQRISTSKINDMSNIRQLRLRDITLQDIISNDHFTNLQSLEIWHISDEITYNQLNRFLNISSIKNLVFPFRINSKLFYDILKYNTTQISIEIYYDDLIEILRRATSHNRHQIIIELKKIKQLNLKYRFKYRQSQGLTVKQVKKICYLFSNIEQLFITDLFESNESIPLLIRKLKHLSFLCISFHEDASIRQIDISNIRQWLIDQSRTKLNENNFICKWSETVFHRTFYLVLHFD
ncbi:unnamed protein product [Rotaria sp. Silwood1]|nr:unnamed protein product [Rotaria sp. Silwood1]